VSFQFLVARATISEMRNRNYLSFLRVIQEIPR
jgi:hypothetical protein